eukprot:SAG31_NODE_1324_length_8789_cov_2.736249_6_plen_88_part_00
MRLQHDDAQLPSSSPCVLVVCVYRAMKLLTMLGLTPDASAVDPKTLDEHLREMTSYTVSAFANIQYPSLDSSTVVVEVSRWVCFVLG